MMKTVLVIGTNNTLGRQLVSFLLKNQYEVKILADETNYFDFALSPDILPISLAANTSIKSEFLAKVDSIIICLDNNYADINKRFGQTIFTFEQLSNLVKAISDLSNNTKKILFDFTNLDSNLQSVWSAVDDVVMGGVSQSNFYLTEDRAIFTGYVSTDNNGGFASVRTRNFDSPLDLSSYQGIELKIKGDGKRYKFITRCEGKWDGISYCYSFDTIYNFPLTILIPFSQLIPVFRAKTVQQAEKFDSSKVYSLQLMLSKFEYDGQLNSKFEPGNFNLAIESIKAYRDLTTPQLIVLNSGQDDSLEKIIDSDCSNYTLVRRSAMETIPTNKIFELDNLNITQNNNSVNPLVQLAIKSFDSPEAFNQVWQINF
jgi:hypothetical protein